MRPFALYRRLVGISIRSQLQYKLSFAMSALANLLVTGGEFLGLWALFSRFGELDGWTLGQICIFYGLANLAFAIADALTAGFDSVGEMVRLGQFDRILLRPRSSVLMLLGHEFTLRRVGRLLQATAVLAYGVASSASLPVPLALPLLVWTLAGAVSLFLGLRILQACVAFKTVESIEIMNVFTYGGVTTASYPFTIYVEWFRRLFVYAIPLAAVSYYPGLLLMGTPDPLGAPLRIGWISPAAGPLFLLVSLAAWRWALRWYVSTGS